MKKSILAMMLAILLACTNDETSTESTASTATAATLTNVPDSLAQPMSKSLNGSGNAISASSANGPLAIANQSLVYTYVKQNADFAKVLMQDMAITFVALDEQIENATSGQCVDSYTINVTAELKAKMIKMMSELGGTTSQLESTINNLPDSVSNTDVGAPAFTYTEITEGGFKKELKLTSDAQGNATCGASPASTEVIRYNDDKTKTQVVSTQTFGTDSIKMQISNDNTAKKTTMIFSGSFGTFKMKDRVTIKTCSSTEASGTTGTCNIIDFDFNFTDGTITGKINGSGKADNSGGMAIAKMNYDSGGCGGGGATPVAAKLSFQATAGTCVTDYYKEQWGADGSLKYIGTATAANGAYTTIAGTEESNTQYEETSYDVGEAWTFSNVSLGDGAYAIVISGKNPSTDGDAVIVGAGFEDATATGGNLEWEFWGAEGGTYDIWEYDLDDSSFSDYGSDVTVTAASNQS